MIGFSFYFDKFFKDENKENFFFMVYAALCWLLHDVILKTITIVAILQSRKYNQSFYGPSIFTFRFDQSNRKAFSVIFNFESELLDLAASAVLNYEKIRKYSTPASHYAGLKIGDKLFVSSGNPKKRQQL